MILWLGAAALLITPVEIPAVRIRRGGSPLGAIEVARLVGLGLSAGLPLPAAFAHAADELPGALGEELRDLLRRARTRGLAHALLETEGRLAELAVLLARAHLSGAPMEEAVRSFIRARATADRAAALRRIRALPVALLVPIALFLLPGFVALVMGPVMLEQLGSLWTGMAP